MYKVSKVVDAELDRMIDDDEDRAGSGTKVGGYPNWCQGVEYPEW